MNRDHSRLDVSLWAEHIDLNSPVPRHAQLRDIIERHLARDSYDAGDLLPGELELVEHFHITRPTVRQALADLEADGWIERRRGVGTTITRARANANLMTVDPRHSFAAPVDRAEGDVSIKVTRRSCPAVSIEVAEVLDTRQTVQVERILLIAERVVGACQTWLVQERFGDLMTKPLIGASISRTLIETYGLAPTSRDIRLRSVRAGKTEAVLFKLSLRSPVVQLRTIEHDIAGEVLWYAMTTYDPREVSVELMSVAVPVEP
jgi:GntR family transcriptional regulator